MEYSHPYFFISGISVIVAHHTSSVEEGEQNLRTAHRSLFNIEFTLVRQVSLGLKIENLKVGKLMWFRLDFAKVVKDLK